MVGDKVIQQTNNYDKEIFNGDIGYISAIDMEEASLHVQFEGKTVYYPFSDLDELHLAYAMSIHKSQGSEYPAVIIPVTIQHYRMLARNLLYTGVTRGKKLVILIGQKKALGIAVHTTQTNERLTQLQQQIEIMDI
jgi:exodeoxyribonuclease V alpha subunit